MAMDRREFVKFIALIAAGAAAGPPQIAAFTQYYEVNTPKILRVPAAVDEVWISGVDTRSSRVGFYFYRGEERVQQFWLNCFGGVIRWVAHPEGKIIGEPRALRWKLEALDEHIHLPDVGSYLRGQISWIDADGKRHYTDLDREAGALG